MQRPKDVQSAQTAGAFWVRNYSFCYHMSTLLTKRILTSYVEQNACSKTKAGGELSNVTLNNPVPRQFKKPHCAVLWRMTYFVLFYCYIIYLWWLILREALHDAPQFIFMQILSLCPFLRVQSNTYWSSNYANCLDCWKCRMQIVLSTELSTLLKLEEIDKGCSRRKSVCCGCAVLLTENR